MAWLEITIDTAAEKIDSVVTVLTAKGFADLVIEDQEEFETFLEENRAYWDYIDESLQAQLFRVCQTLLCYSVPRSRAAIRRNNAVHPS